MGTDGLGQLSKPAQVLYHEGFARFADDNGICKANQRELVAATRMAFKTLIPARDELEAAGLIVRYKYRYQGKRDWYRVISLQAVRAKQRYDELSVRRERIVERATFDACQPSLPLGLPMMMSGLESK